MVSAVQKVNLLPQKHNKVYTHLEENCVVCELLQREDCPGTVRLLWSRLSQCSHIHALPLGTQKDLIS